MVYGRGARSRDALPPSELVWAGAEPTEFTNLFPVWRHDAAVEALNKKVGTVMVWCDKMTLLGNQVVNSNHIESSPDSSQICLLIYFSMSQFVM